MKTRIIPIAILLIVIGIFAAVTFGGGSGSSSSIPAPTPTQTAMVEVPDRICLRADWFSVWRTNSGPKLAFAASENTESYSIHSGGSAQTVTDPYNGLQAGQVVSVPIQTGAPVWMSLLKSDGSTPESQKWDLPPECQNAPAAAQPAPLPKISLVGLKLISVDEAKASGPFIQLSGKTWVSRGSLMISQEPGDSGTGKLTALKIIETSYPGWTLTIRVLGDSYVSQTLSMPTASEVLLKNLYLGNVTEEQVERLDLRDGSLVITPPLDSFGEWRIGTYVPAKPQ